MKRGIVLFAHGARDPRWAEPFARVADAMRAADAGTPVAVAFLERMRPTLAEAVVSLLAAGAREVDVVPVFLGMGGHVRDDLPPLVESLRDAHPDVAFRLHGALGERPDVIAALARAALAAGDGAR